MKSVLPILIVGAIIAAGAYWVAGQRELTGIRDSNATLSRQIAAAGANAFAAAPSAESPGGISPDEQTELLRLRGEIQPLRRQVRDLSNQVASAAKPAAVAPRPPTSPQR